MPNPICFPHLRHALRKRPEVRDLLPITTPLRLHRQHIPHRQRLVLHSTPLLAPTIDSNRVTTTATHRSTSLTVASSSTPISHTRPTSHSSPTRPSTRSAPAAPKTGSRSRCLAPVRTCTLGESLPARSTAAANTATAMAHCLTPPPRPRSPPASRSIAAHCRQQHSPVGGSGGSEGSEGSEGSGSRRGRHCAAGSPSARRSGRSAPPRLPLSPPLLPHSSDCGSTRAYMRPPPPLPPTREDLQC